MTTNPYQTTSQDSPSLQANGRRRFARGVAILLLLTGPFWFVMSGLQTKLLKAGLINTKDMAPFFGNETGTFTEYMLNVWHWDVGIFLLFMATIPNTLFAIWLLCKRSLTAS
jgi:hypothetical protein